MFFGFSYLNGLKMIIPLKIFPEKGG